MNDHEDIAVRLRSPMRMQSGTPWSLLMNEAAIEIERLRAERDGARAEVCLLRASSTTASDVVDQSMADYAESRGWDCFKENTDDR